MLVGEQPEGLGEGGRKPVEVLQLLLFLQRNRNQGYLPRVRVKEECCGREEGGDDVKWTSVKMEE